MKIVVRFKVSDKFRQAVLVKTGKEMNAVQEIVLDTEQLTITQREAIVGYNGLQTLLSIATWTTPIFIDTSWSPHSTDIALDGIPSVDEIVAHCARMRAERDAAQAAINQHHEQKLAFSIAEAKKWLNGAGDGPNPLQWLNSGYKIFPQYTEAVSLKDEIDAAEKLRKEKLAAEERLAQEKRQAEKAEWIIRHGSDHLKRAFARGYDCQRQYVKERAAMEYPGFEVDFDDRAGWKNRSMPSKKGLDLSEKYEGSEVVWLTDAIEDDDFEPCEAVVVRKFLGRYDLIRIV